MPEADRQIFDTVEAHHTDTETLMKNIGKCPVMNEVMKEMVPEERQEFAKKMKDSIDQRAANEPGLRDKFAAWKTKQAETKSEAKPADTLTDIENLKATAVPLQEAAMLINQTRHKVDELLFDQKDINLSTAKESVVEQEVIAPVLQSQEQLEQDFQHLAEVNSVLQEIEATEHSDTPVDQPTVESQPPVEKQVSEIVRSLEAPRIETVQHKQPEIRSVEITDIPRRPDDKPLTFGAVEKEEVPAQLIKPPTTPEQTYMPIPFETSEFIPIESDDNQHIENELGMAHLTTQLTELFAEYEMRYVEPQIVLFKPAPTQTEAAELLETLENKQVIDGLFATFVQTLQEQITEIEPTKPELIKAVSRLEAVLAEAEVDEEQFELTEQVVEGIMTVLTHLGCEEPRQTLLDYANSHSLPELFAELEKVLPELTKLIDYQQHLLTVLARTSTRKSRHLNAAEILTRLLFGTNLRVAVPTS